MKKLLFMLLLAFPLPTHAILLGLPVQCEMGKACFLQNYADHDTGPRWKDYRCGLLSYDGHRGTDIRVPTMAELNPGVDVVAVARGKVVGRRDGMADISVKQADPKTIKGKECGNGVVIDHGDGWVTQYCHLKKDSIAVEKNAKVKQGDVLGKIGMSGAAEFPHVHFEIRHNGHPVDPFTGRSMESACGQTGLSLWTEEAQKALVYQDTGVIVSGFTTEAPTADAVLEGKHRLRLIPTDADAIIFWAQAFGLKPEQTLEITLRGPDGAVLAESTQGFERHKAQYFKFIGCKRTSNAWPGGAYKGEYRISTMAGEKRKTVIDYRATLLVE
jgi:murein DD-endopeptidase MepM/ murein hydrolase activator NlpD